MWFVEEPDRRLRGIVFDDDELEVAVILPQDALDRRREIGVVVHREDDGHAWHGA